MDRSARTGDHRTPVIGEEDYMITRSGHGRAAREPPEAWRAAIPKGTGRPAGRPAGAERAPAAGARAMGKATQRH